MKMYQNIMENIVEEQFDILNDTLGCCTCQQCRSDIIAFALNQLPSRYVATSAGSTISKADSLRIQHMTDVRTALIKGAQIVKEHPRH
jgi:competence protein ComFB